MRRFVACAVTMALLVSLTGCGPTPVAQTGPAVPPVPVVPAPPPPPPPPPVAPPPPVIETIKAEVGVGQKGRSLDEYEGVVVTPVKTLFAFRERAVFEIQVPHALNLFNATEGRMPKTHEEFMEKIIKANQIPLPELPPNHRYKWDPELKELMVERPKAVAAPQ